MIDYLQELSDEEHQKIMNIPEDFNDNLDDEDAELTDEEDSSHSVQMESPTRPMGPSVVTVPYTNLVTFLVPLETMENNEYNRRSLSKFFLD